MKSFLLIIFLLCTSTVQSSEDELKVVTENWPPFIIKGKVISGIVTKNIKEILAFTDIKYSIKLYPWARSLHLAKTKPNVLIYSILRTKQREAKFNWICPIYKSTAIHVYKLASNEINVNSLESIRTGVVGVMRGDHGYSFFVQKGFEEGINLDLSSNEEINLKKLITGRVDVVIQAKESLSYRLKSIGANNLNLVSGLAIGEGESVEHCMALSLGTKPETINKIRTGFKLWQKEQE
ncbi:MAG: transporter substrate-binding domain-containing protein [Colwellia sp.]|nr:transporter substrate-binding domain-containing protein [Colwellia sp.]